MKIKSKMQQATANQVLHITSIGFSQNMMILFYYHNYTSHQSMHAICFGAHHQGLSVNINTTSDCVKNLKTFPGKAKGKDLITLGMLKTQSAHQEYLYHAAMKYICNQGVNIMTCVDRHYSSEKTLSKI